MTEAIKLDTLDDYYIIDEETGEILEKRIELTVKELPQIAHRLAYYEKKAQELDERRKEETEYPLEVLNRIKEKCDAADESLEKQRAFWLGQAQLLMEQIGEKKLVYHGLGRFRWQKGSTVLDPTGYNEAPEDDKIKIRSEYEIYFKYKEPQPAITNIKEDMRSGRLDEHDRPLKLSDYFKLITNEDKFIFKGE